jgi:hypothetical protein
VASFEPLGPPLLPWRPNNPDAGKIFACSWRTPPSEPKLIHSEGAKRFHVKK